MAVNVLLNDIESFVMLITPATNNASPMSSPVQLVSDHLAWKCSLARDEEL